MKESDLQVSQREHKEFTYSTIYFMYYLVGTLKVPKNPQKTKAQIV